MNEPQDRSLVLFEFSHDMEVWFRSDRTADHARGPEANDDERWFRVGEDDGDPVSWQALLDSYVVAPVLLERAS